MELEAQPTTEELTPERVSVTAQVEDYSKTTVLCLDEVDGESVFVPPLSQLKSIVLSEVLGSNTPNFSRITDVVVTPTTSTVTLESIKTLQTNHTNLNKAQILRLFFEACWCAFNSIRMGLSLADYDSFELVDKYGNPEAAHYVLGEHVFTVDTQKDLPFAGDYEHPQNLAVSYKPRQAGAISRDTMNSTGYKGEFEVIRSSKDTNSDSVSVYDIRSMTGYVPELEANSPFESDIGAAELWFLGLHLFNLVTGVDVLQKIQMGSSPLLESFRILRLVDPEKFEREISRIVRDFPDDEFWKVVVSAHLDELDDLEIDLGLREKSDRFVFQDLPIGAQQEKRTKKLLKTFGRTIRKLTRLSPANRVDKLSGSALSTLSGIISGHLFEGYRIDTLDASPETVGALTTLEDYYFSNSGDEDKWYWSDSGELAENLEKIRLSREPDTITRPLFKSVTEQHMEACEYCGYDYHKSYLRTYGDKHCEFRHKKYCSPRCYSNHVYIHNLQ